MKYRIALQKVGFTIARRGKHIVMASGRRIVTSEPADEFLRWHQAVFFDF